MEMRSIGQSPNMGGIPNKSSEIKNEYPNLTNLKDRLTKLDKEDSELKQQMTVLKANADSFNRSKNVNRKARKITTAAALTGGAIFMGAALMSSGVGFVVGGAIGAVSYIASGWFKGRTQWFAGQENNETLKLQQNSARHSAISTEMSKINDTLTKAETQVKDLTEGLKSSGGAIQDKNEYVEIGGVKLRKNKPGVFKYLDDLFSPLDKS